jgi:hypothetical protein
MNIKGGLVSWGDSVADVRAKGEDDGWMNMIN